MLIVLEFVEFDCVSYVREEHVLVFFQKKKWNAIKKIQI